MYVNVCVYVFEGLEVLRQVVMCRKERGRRSEVRRGAKYIPPILPGSCPDIDLIDSLIRKAICAYIRQWKMGIALANSQVPHDACAMLPPVSRAPL